MSIHGTGHRGKPTMPVLFRILGLVIHIEGRYISSAAGSSCQERRLPLALQESIDLGGACLQRRPQFFESLFGEACGGCGDAQGGRNTVSGVDNRRGNG